MSSPLSMLKKTKRTPLQGLHNEQWSKQKVSFRRNLLKEIQAELVDESSDHSQTPAFEAVPSNSGAPLKKGSPPSNFELMSAMMQRVTLLEEMVKSQAREIEHKDKQISDLEKLSIWEKSGSTCGPRSRDDLERRCQQLQNQVHEMENFLNDYGLIWVGDKVTGDPAQQEMSGGRGFDMNFDLVLQRIRELNIFAGEGESFVQTTATGAQLATKDPIPLRLYRNGIVMFDGPFRSYQEHSTQQCMQDLMDGYFPSELQERFPDGVPFEVHDRRDEEFIFRLPWETFPGEGQTLCGEKAGSASALSSHLPGKKLTTEQFLNKLPKFLVKAGRVIDIRNSLRATLQGSSDAQSTSSVTLIDTPSLQAITEGPQAFSADQPPSARHVITLKVKSEDGDHTYTVKMCLSETVGDLRKYLDRHRGGRVPSYDIICAYPHCSFDDDGQTLQSCGLATNTTLLLRRRKHSPSLVEVNKAVQVTRSQSSRAPLGIHITDVHLTNLQDLCDDVSMDQTYLNNFVCNMTQPVVGVRHKLD
ncbi:UBX domain-containing protein 11 [Archocentrus centrarchus]|uniref:UBX domain-containing protein 11 n=1 Tax=Archocentrus centrarchus TaxID=63155 RepID=UPI0011E9F99C|nr:UBX domain-containing protein 11 [Archocentrus centrarchus]